MNGYIKTPESAGKKMALAEQLREANVGGVTRWLGLKERLDASVLADFDNFRELLRQRLGEKLSEKPVEDEEQGEEQAEIREKAKKLLAALDAYENDEEGNGDDDDAAA